MSARFVATTRKKRDPERADTRRDPVLVIAHHPRLARAGERVVLDTTTELSRLAPAFATGSLDDPFVSRQPIVLRRLAHGIEISNPHGVEVAVRGAQLRTDEICRVEDAELEHGIDIVLGGRIVLWLALDDPHAAGGDDLGLIGQSAGMRALRDDIRAAATLDTPVLIVGETGVGKELVARALHAASARANGPLVVVNVAAIPAAVAAAELFGHERGSFTGAGDKRAGYFERAAGGTLFLDEIGELPDAIQPMLLRALETGEIQPIGGQPRRVEVRVLAATDADLQAGDFRAPLYFRIAATTIEVPPLRERGADIGLLFARMLGEALPATLADQTTAETAWLPAPIVAQLLHAPWPGNVRELRNVAQRLAAIAHAGRVATLDDVGIFDVDTRDDEPASGGPIDDERLVAVLRSHRFQLNRAAEQLGISRTHLDALIARNPRLRKAKDLERAEIEASAAAHDNDVDAMANGLEVSPRGLRLRMRQLGLG
ncbi:MAG TPA: sigma 54-interacting transcriptional regulator [Kofleriaceae bacterium]